MKVKKNKVRFREENKSLVVKTGVKAGKAAPERRPVHRWNSDNPEG